MKNAIALADLPAEIRGVYGGEKVVGVFRFEDVIGEGYQYLVKIQDEEGIKGDHWKYRGGEWRYEVKYL